MTVNLLSTDLKALRNIIQDLTTNPYAASTNTLFSGSSTKYVFAFTKKPAAATPTSPELRAKESRERDLPLIVDLTLVGDPSTNMHRLREFTVLVRVFCRVDTRLTFNSVLMEAEELAMSKLDEIREKLNTNLAVQQALVAEGMFLLRGGLGGIRPLTGQENDFGFACELTLYRQDRT